MLTCFFSKATVLVLVFMRGVGVVGDRTPKAELDQVVGNKPQVEADLEKAGS